MVMYSKSEGRRTEGPTGGVNGHYQGGPVFLPPRKPSLWAESLMASLAQAEGLGEGRSVTGYDEIWYGNRDQA